MARRPASAPPVATLLGSADDVEAQFYEALRRADIEGLMMLWADDDEIVCVHPGGRRVIGAAAIRASFEAIFAGGGIAVQPEQVHRLAHLAGALHHLVERIEVRAQEGTRLVWVLATNLYIKTALGWRLACHHASSASTREPPALADDAPATLH
jgi:ketosteroid isomerase-like protein